MADQSDIGDYGRGGWKVVVVAGVLVLMLILMTLGRFASRSLKKSSVQRDDVMVIVSSLLTFALCAIAMACPPIAGISPYITSPTSPPSSSVNAPQEPGSNPFDAVRPSNHNKPLFLAFTLLYGITLAASKWAILLLYVRVFTTSSRWFNIVLGAMGVLVTGTAVAHTFGVVFVCGGGAGGVRKAWGSQSEILEKGECMDLRGFEEAMAIPNVVSGVVMLLMPLPSVVRLNISRVQKVGLAATFLHGVIGVIASIARLCALAYPSSAATDLTIWLLNEPANYIIAACLPTLRPLFRLVLPESFFLLSNPARSSRGAGGRGGRSELSKPSVSTFKISWVGMGGWRAGEVDGSRQSSSVGGSRGRSRLGSIVPIRVGWEREAFVRPLAGGSRGAAGEGVAGGGGEMLLERRERSTWNLNVFDKAGARVGGGLEGRGERGEGTVSPGAKSPKEGVTIREDSLGSQSGSGTAASTRRGSTTVVRFDDGSEGGARRSGSSHGIEDGRETMMVVDLNKV